jgi:Spy/CpxP family protein refolding chaperone
MTMRSLSRLALPLALTLAAPALGCSGGVTSEPPTSAQAATTRAPVAQSTHGPLKLLGDAMGDVPLTAAQRAQVEQLATDAEARHADARAARQALVLALADQVQSGAVDRPALQPKIDALSAAIAKAQPADRSSLEQLHAVLTADQRTAFVDALEARIAEHKGKALESHPLKRWADDLKLSVDQRAQIMTALHDRFAKAAHGDHPEHAWMEGAHHGEKVLAAFKQDRFVLDEVAPARDVSQAAAKMSDHVLGLAETVLPLLTADQRSLLAAKLRERANAGEELGPGL